MRYSSTSASPASAQRMALFPTQSRLPEMLEFWADPSSPYHRDEFLPERRIILHCASGGRSALAANTLQELGYSNVAHMDGGIKAWNASRRPVTSGSS